MDDDQHNVALEPWHIGHVLALFDGGGGRLAGGFRAGEHNEAR